MNSTSIPETSVTISIPHNGSEIKVAVKKGKPVFVLGRNGTGKSALVHHLRRSIGDRVVYLPGSRPSYFESESLSMTPASRRSLTQNLKGWDDSPETRWRSISGTARNERAIHDLQAAEVQFKVDAANEVRQDGANAKAIALLQSRTSPFDRINALLTQANLPTNIILDGGELKAIRSGAIYSIAKMSDGERTALIIAAEVVSATDDAVFLIDEPELHLHRSIVIPLLVALFAERPTCGFVISTHELDLPGASAESTAILVRSVTWQNEAAVAWDVDILDDTREIPDSLRTDLVGSRRKILFVEGTSVSLDQPLYALLFPDLSVRCRESCREVIRAVAGLRSIETLHHTRAYGLVDNDGMSDEQRIKLELGGIFPINLYAVESLYYSEEALQSVAIQQATTLGTTADQLLSDAKSLGLKALAISGKPEHLAARICERKIRDKLLVALPDRQTIIDTKGENITVSLAAPFRTELDRVSTLVSLRDLGGIIAAYPVRETGVLDGLVSGLKFRNRLDYEKAVLTRVGAEPTLRAALQLKLGGLALALAPTPVQISR